MIITPALGFLFLLFVGLVALIWLRLKRQAKKTKSLAWIPPHITVVPVAHLNWRDAKEEERLTVGLRELQFYEVGTFTIPELNLFLKGFLRPEDRVMAAIFEHPETGVWVDLCIEYENKTSLTVSNAPLARDFSQCPGHQKIIERELNLDELIKLLEDRRGAEPARFISPFEIPEIIREAYAREYDWQKNRGEPKAQEVLKVTREMERDVVLPCLKGPCPYEYGSNSDREIEGMPFPTKAGDPRACPIYGHLCPRFMEELGLTVEDLRIRATIHCASVADQMVQDGKLGKDSREYRELTSRRQEIMTRYPVGQYPQYYR